MEPMKRVFEEWSRVLKMIFQVREVRITKAVCDFDKTTFISCPISLVQM